MYLCIVLIWNSVFEYIFLFIYLLRVSLRSDLHVPFSIFTYSGSFLEFPWFLKQKGERSEEIAKSREDMKAFFPLEVKGKV